MDERDTDVRHILIATATLIASMFLLLNAARSVF
jgi:hypothetical protein